MLEAVIIFKCKLNSDINAIPRYFYAGNRRAQVLHTRLGTKCCLFQKHIIYSPIGLCGNVENTDHYLMHCQLNRVQRAELNHKISQHTTVTLQILLFGSPSLFSPTNTLIFEEI